MEPNNISPSTPSIRAAEAIAAMRDEMKEKLSLIRATIEFPYNLKIKVEEEERSFLKELSRCVEEINKGLASAIRHGECEYSVEITYTQKDITKFGDPSRIIDTLKDLYISKGYKATVVKGVGSEVYNTHFRYYNVTISF